MGIRREEEMEMSDDDSGDNPSKKLRVDDSGKAKSLYNVKYIQLLVFWNKNKNLYMRRDILTADYIRQYLILNPHKLLIWMIQAVSRRCLSPAMIYNDENSPVLPLVRSIMSL